MILLQLTVFSGRLTRALSIHQNVKIRKKWTCAENSGIFSDW
jgi:hypothetical protein